MCYVLTNGIKYIQKIGKNYLETDNINDAFKLSSEKSALNLRDITINDPSITKLYYPIKFSLEQDKFISISGRDKSNNSYYKVLATIGNKFAELVKDEDELSNQLSHCDLIISDVYHSIEFANKKITQKQSQHLINDILKPTLIKRREIKDKLYIIHSIKSNITIGGLGTVMDQIENMDNRKFTYKVLDL